jgi:hypothetical protein
MPDSLAAERQPLVSLSVGDEGDKVCRNCGKRATRPVGSGRRTDGVFCSLKCYARFYADYLRTRNRQTRGRSLN